MGRPAASCDDRPVHSLGDDVEKRDIAGRIRADHGVTDAVERDDGEFLLDEELLLRRLAGADVADGGGHEDPSALSSGLSMISIGNSGAVLAQRHELDPGADLLGQGVGGRAQVVGDDPLGEPSGMMFVPAGR